MNCFYVTCITNAEKVKFLLQFSFPLVSKLCRKTSVEKFIGGRKGHDKEKLFSWLLIKKVSNWDYRTIASMARVSHPTLIRANDVFLRKRIYQKVFSFLIRKAKKKGFIKGQFIAYDAMEEWKEEYKRLLNELMQYPNKLLRATIKDYEER